MHLLFATMQPANSPETLPSLAETSRSSHLEVDDIARALFQTPEREEDGTLGYSLSGDVSGEGDRDSLFGSEISVGTQEDETYTQSIETYLTDLDHTTLDYSTTTGGTNQRDTTTAGHFVSTCQGALSISPKDFVGMFNLFDRSKQGALDANTPKSNATSAVTEVISNLGRDLSSVASSREIESLQRECNTLKEIIKADSENLLNLRAELETVRNSPQSQGSDHDDSTHARVYKERELLLKREKLYEERIKQLTEAMNKMKDGSGFSKRIDQLQLENELLSFQIIELERTNRNIIEENETLKQQLVMVRRLDPVPEETERKKSNSILRMQVASLSARLEEIEHDMVHRERERAQRLSDSMDSSGILVSPSPNRSADSVDSENTGTGNDAPELVANDSEVEVTLDGLIISTSTSGEFRNELRKLPRNDQAGLAPPASRYYFCDCFSGSKEDTL